MYQLVLRMIGYIVCLCSIAFSVLSVILYARDNYHNMFYALFVLIFSAICYRVCICSQLKWYNADILFLLFTIWNNIMLVGVCGILYGGIDWFLTVCVCLCVSSSVACIYEHYGYIEKDTILPRITFLEI